MTMSSLPTPLLLKTSQLTSKVTVPSFCQNATRFLSTSSMLKNERFFGGKFGLPEPDYLELAHMRGPLQKIRKNKNPLGPRIPYAKGVVLRTLVKKPKKPNAANRKCVLLKLSNGKEMTAYVPGEGHNLQEHSTVLVRCGRLRDVPGVKLKCVRGAYDLGHVIKKKQ